MEAHYAELSEVSPSEEDPADAYAQKEEAYQSSGLDTTPGLHSSEGEESSDPPSEAEDSERENSKWAPEYTEAQRWPDDTSSDYESVPSLVDDSEDEEEKDRPSVHAVHLLRSDVPWPK